MSLKLRKLDCKKWISRARIRAKLSSLRNFITFLTKKHAPTHAAPVSGSFGGCRPPCKPACPSRMSPLSRSFPQCIWQSACCPPHYSVPWQRVPEFYPTVVFGQPAECSLKFFNGELVSLRIIPHLDVF